MLENSKGLNAPEIAFKRAGFGETFIMRNTIPQLLASNLHIRNCGEIVLVV